MNIKRAFLTAVALLVVPGFALAQTTVTFDTSVSTTNGADVTVNAALTCNTGNPLSQNLDISPGNGVNFTVQQVTIDANTACGITFSGIPSSYEVSAVNTNGTADTAAAPHCSWDQSNLSDANTCELVLAPAPFTYSVVMTWDAPDDNVTDLNAGVNWTCYNVSDSTGGLLGTFTDTFTFTGPATQTMSVSTLYADDGGTSYCVAQVAQADSAVEFVPMTCGNQPVSIGSSVTCTIAATVFFEGIPTLGQYGLAIMALLMLGVGFIGFRRFV